MNSDVSSNNISVVHSEKEIGHHCHGLVGGVVTTPLWKVIVTGMIETLLITM